MVCRVSVPEWRLETVGFLFSRSYRAGDYITFLITGFHPVLGYQTLTGFVIAKL